MMKTTKVFPLDILLYMVRISLKTYVRTYNVEASEKLNSYIVTHSLNCTSYFMR